MPNFYIYDYTDTQFDSVTFAVSEKGKKTERVIEGRTIKIQYVQKENMPASSTLQIIRNLQNAARVAGGQGSMTPAATTGTTPLSVLPGKARKSGYSSKPAATPIGSQSSSVSRCSRSRDRRDLHRQQS